MGGFRGVCGLVLGMIVCVWGGLYAVEPTIPLYLYNGNVGVGTETPQRLFHVGGDFQVGLIPTMSVVVTSAGRLGIGTTSPTEPLHVVGNLRLGTVTDMLFSNNIAHISSAAPMSIYSNSETIFKNTSEVEFLRITNRGNVGIGTATPRSRLDIGGGVFRAGSYTSIGKAHSSNDQLSFNLIAAEDGGSFAPAYFGEAGAGGSMIGMSAGGMGDLVFKTMRFGTDGTPKQYNDIPERMRITDGGNVGIGTTAPSEKLSVNGALGITASEEYVYLYSTYTVGSNSRVRMRAVGAGGGSGYGGDFRVSTRTSLNTWNDDAFVIDSAGRVGIGTASPTEPLHVVGNLRLGTVKDMILSNNIAHISSAAPMSIYSNSETIFKNTSEVEFLRITNTGNVGIGTASPAVQFEVQRTTTGIIRASAADNPSIYYAELYGNFDTRNFGGVRTSQGNLIRYINSPAGATYIGLGDKLSVLDTGKVGIGTTSPTEPLHVVGNLRLGAVTDRIFSNNIAQISSSAPMSIYSNSETIFKNTSEVEFLRITNTGLVGIGTPSPTHPLHVSGNALISSRMAINAPINNAYHLNVGGAIRANEIVVNLNGWADYVFEPDYKLMPLSEVESFVKQNRHLPGMPSEAELTASGLNMAKVQTLQMQKIEELTLYVIALEKQNKALEARMEALEKRVSR